MVRWVASLGPVADSWCSVVGCVAVPAVPLMKCLSTLCHMRCRLKANIQPADSSMCLQLLDLSTWESGQMPNGTVAAGRTTSFMERWVASLGQVADSYCNFEDEQEQCLLKSHSDISTGDSVLDY